MKNNIILNNGVEMPRIGYGVYQIPSVITERCVTDALKVGYRLIDTAQCYGNEKQVGVAVKKSGIARDDIFITTKLWGTRGYSDTVKSIDGSIKALGTEYIDLMLIHEPTGDFCEIYRAMEDAYKAGKLRAVGVANFLEENYKSLLKTAEIIPAVDQIETHIFRQQREMGTLLQKTVRFISRGRRLPADGTAFLKILCLRKSGRNMAKRPRKSVCVSYISRILRLFPNLLILKE